MGGALISLAMAAPLTAIYGDFAIGLPLGAVTGFLLAL